MKLEVVLGASQGASFSITLNNNSFVRKWAEELRWCVTNCEFNQTEAFATMLPLRQAEKILTESCKTINRYLKGYIDIRSNIAEQPQEYFNYLHRIFEKLSGSYTHPTRLLTVAPPELKTAVRNLNFFVHRVETKAAPCTSLYISFNKDQYRRHPLADNDYEFFEFKFPAGTLFLHYAELGKEFIDLYEDQLPIDYEGFKNLHYYSGEASLTFFDYDAFGDQQYFNWLKNNNINPYNKHLGHGKIPLGVVDDLDQAKKLLEQYKHIYTVNIKE